MVGRPFQLSSFRTALRHSSNLRLRLKSSGLDKWLIPYGDDDWPELKTSESDIEFAILRLFMIDLHRLIELKATISKNFHINPSEIDAMPFWEYELFIMSLNEQVQEENDRQKAEMDKYHVDEHMDSMRPGKMQKTMSSMTPKMPAMPSFGSMPTPSFKF